MTHLKVLLLIRILLARGFCRYVPRVKLQGDCTKKFVSVLYVKIFSNEKEKDFCLTILDMSSTYLVVYDMLNILSKMPFFLTTLLLCILIPVSKFTVCTCLIFLAIIC